MSDAITARREKQRKMMLEGPILKIIPIVAVPMILCMLVDSIYNMADTYFVSQLGTTATAAVGINDSLLQYIRAAAMGFGVGACSYISRLLGARRDEEAHCVATTTLYTSMGIMLFVAILGYIFMSPMVSLLGATETAKPYSMDYATYILISAPFTAGEVVLTQLLRSEGSTKYSMIGLVIGCGLNCILDPIFISTFGLEVAGAAIATTLSKVVSFCILITPFIKKHTMLEIGRKYFKPKWKVYSEVIKMGVPTFLRSALMTSSFVVINNIAGGFSDAALAAASISKKSTGFVSAAVMGFGQGFQPIAGFCWGAKKYKRVRDSFWACTFIGWAAAIVLGAVMAIFSRSLVAVFTTPDETELIRIGSLMIFSQCLVLIPHVWGVVVNGLCQALGRPIYSTLVGLARNFICLIPSVLIMSAIFGVNGLATSQAVADFLSLAICIPIVISLIHAIKRHEIQDPEKNIINESESVEEHTEDNLETRGQDVDEATTDEGLSNDVEADEQDIDETAIKYNLESIIQEQFNSIVQEKLESIVQDNLESIVQDNLKSIVQDNLKSIIQDNEESITKNKLDSVKKDNEESAPIDKLPSDEYELVE